MASISYPTSLKVEGPLLLDIRNLIDLDGVISSCAAKMRQRRDDLAALAVFEEKEQLLSRGKSVEEINEMTERIRVSILSRFPFNKDNRRVTVFLPGGRAAESLSFAELVPVPQLNEEIPKGFSAVVEVGQDEVKVELGTWLPDLSVGVSSEDDEFAQELFGRLQNWASEIQPKRWLQLWRKTSEFLIPIAVMGAIVTTMFLAVFMLTPRSGPSEVQMKARELARQGVDQSNQTQALELLLSMESGYAPTPTPPKHWYPSARIWALYAVFLLLVAAYTQVPRDSIGLWSGRRIVERQRRWVRFVSISIPTVLASSLLVPLLARLLGWPI